jgi:hypothetical protein
MNLVSNTSWGGRIRAALTLCLTLLLFAPGVALAANIVIDGQFDDWVGQPTLADPAGDAPARYDIAAIFWATNPGDPTAYFMIQRAPGPPGQVKKSVFYRIFVDTNNDGNYDEASDREIDINFNPGSPVSVVTLSGDGHQIGAATGAGDGGQNVEIGVPFAKLGIGPNQTFRFYVAAYTGAADSTPADRAPDSGDIQWAPVPALGYPLLVLVGVGVIAFVIWRQRWLIGRLQK